MFRRRNNKAFRRASWLAVLAVLFQALLPAVHDVGMAFAGEPRDMAMLGDVAHHLCLAPGSDAPSTPKAPGQLSQSCTLCTAVHAVATFVPPAVPVVAVSENCRPIILAASGKQLPCRPVYPSQQPRAPPALI
jgi:hypothetical protein